MRRALAFGCAVVLVALAGDSASAHRGPTARPVDRSPQVRAGTPPVATAPLSSRPVPPEPRPTFMPPVRTEAPASRKPKSVVKPRSEPTHRAKKRPVEAITRIGGYVFCGSAVASAQRCIDQGSLTLYYPAGVKTLAGHNYMGWSWMDDLPVGRKVVITSGGLAGTYRVYGHGWAKRGSQGGTFPSAGRGASVALQTCTSSGTGFSFLRRA